jgi:hypothetical protein
VIAAAVQTPRKLRRFDWNVIYFSLHEGQLLQFSDLQVTWPANKNQFSAGLTSRQSIAAIEPESVTMMERCPDGQGARLNSFGRPNTLQLQET